MAALKVCPSPVSLVVLVMPNGKLLARLGLRLRNTTTGTINTSTAWATGRGPKERSLVREVDVADTGGCATGLGEWPLFPFSGVAGSLRLSAQASSSARDAETEPIR